MLQEFLFIPLDIAREIYQNGGIRNKTEAWLVFLSNDDPEVILKLIEKYPEFRVMYEDVYELCLNTERVMGMFSKELLELDRNTVQLMIDEMQDEIDAQKRELNEKDVQLGEQRGKIQEQEGKLQEKERQHQRDIDEIARLKEQIKAFTLQN